MRTSYLRALTLIACLGFGTVGLANTCGFEFGPPVPGVPNAEQCNAVSTPTGFEFQQFNPALGQLADGLGFTPSDTAVDFQFAIPEISGTIKLTYGDISTCAPFYPPGCVALSWDISATDSVSNPALGSVGAVSGSGATGSVSFLSNGQQVSVPWSLDYPNNISSPGVDVPYAASQAGPWTGTGTIPFTITGSASADVTGLGFLDSVSANGYVVQGVQVTYSFIPAAVPEPSVLLITGALFGLIAGRKMLGQR